MDMPDDSVDAFFSMFALEHIYRFEAVIDEVYRCLRRRGRFLLGVPFLYYQHGDPDFFRFTRHAMDQLVSRFRVARCESSVNRSLLIAQLMHEKRALGSTRSSWGRAALRLMTTPFLASGLLSNQRMPVYAITHLYLCEKPSG